MTTARKPLVGVTFSYHSATATSVGLCGGWLAGGAPPVMMHKSGADLWQVTVGPLAPNWYTYRFVVDGVSTRDPLNPTVVPSSGNVDTMIMVSGPGTEFMEERDVAHGALHTLHYHSGVVGTIREAVVYTPPGYGSTEARLPMFVLMHGGGGDQWDWTVQGRAHVILDNLLAEGLIDPMVVVMPSVMLPGNIGPGQLIIPTTDQVPAEILDHLVPAVEKAYRVAPAANRRALAGLSMGGFFTWSTLIMRPGEFAWYGDFSSGFFPDGLAWLRTEGAHLFDNHGINSRTRLHAIYCDEVDIAWDNNVGTRALFDEMGVDYTFIEIDGTDGHTWNSWRHHLRDFAPRIF